jgi:uncharacterized metal-binding protein
MPAGHTHTTLNLASTPIVFLTINQLHLIGLPYLATGCASFIFATLFMSPDLDLFNSNPTHHWGVFKYLWLPYSKMFHHRGLSHSLLFGSLTRIFYLTAIALIFTCSYFSLKEILLPMSMSDVNSQIDQSKTLYAIMKGKWEIYHFYIYSAFFGIWLADAYHICSDRIYSSIKGLKPGAHR